MKMLKFSLILLVIAGIMFICEGIGIIRILTVLVSAVDFLYLGNTQQKMDYTISQGQYRG